MDALDYQARTLDMVFKSIEDSLKGTQPKATKRPSETITCDACKAVIPLDEDNQGHFVRIQRGWWQFEDSEFVGDWQISDNADDHNIKFELYICRDCYLKDPDLCRFFNKIGFRTR